MLRHITVGIAALAAIGFAGQAMAAQVDNQTYQVFVNIDVQEEVSMWAATDDVDLVLEGNNAENSDAVQSTISHINNVAADIDVKVEGTLPPKQLAGDPQTLQDQILFFIFDQTTDAAATALMAANSNNPVGALKWDVDDVTPIGGTTRALANVPISQEVSNRMVTYAADAPNILPLVANFNLTVTWTISP